MNVSRLEGWNRLGTALFRAATSFEVFKLNSSKEDANISILLAIKEIQANTAVRRRGEIPPTSHRGDSIGVCPT
jgi:hypothetical protein